MVRIYSNHWPTKYAIQVIQPSPLLMHGRKWYGFTHFALGHSSRVTTPYSARGCAGDIPTTYLCLQDVFWCCFLQFTVPKEDQSIGVSAALLSCSVVRCQKQLRMLVRPVHRRHHSPSTPSVIKQSQLLCDCGAHTRATARSQFNVMSHDIM